MLLLFFFFKQKTAYEMRISDWSSDVCSSDLALLAQRELGAGKFDIVYPSVSILAEPPVAVVDGNARKNGTLAVSEAYLKFLYKIGRASCRERVCQYV